MEINDIVKIAKEVLKERGQYHPQIIAEINGKLHMALILFENDEEKEMAKKGIRQWITKEKPDKYFLIMKGGD